MKPKTFGRAAGAGLDAAVLAVVAMAGPPSAAPVPRPAFRPIAGVGWATRKLGVNALGNVIRSGGNKVIASWDARGSSPIKTKAVNCEFTRPNGSGAGLQALRASEGEDLGGTHGGPGHFMGADVVGCIDFARSSS